MYIMKKNKFYISIIGVLFSFILFSCNNNNLEKGIFYAEYKSNENKEDSYKKAKNLMYADLAQYTGKLIDRYDFEVVAGVLMENNIIDFSNAKITYKNKNDEFITKIKVEDPTIKERAENILLSIKKVGVLKDSIRAFSTIELPKLDNLSAYTRATIERSALNKAHKSLYTLIMDEGMDPTTASMLTNQAYVIEETYSDTEYSVVIETKLN